MDISSFLGGNYLTQVDLPQPHQTWTIGKVDQQMVGQGQNAERKVCVSFAEHPKPLALNKTNLTRVVDLYGLDTNGWVNQPLLVYRSGTTFGNQPTLCVRVLGPSQVPPDSICDSQGNTVPLQATVQPAAASVQQGAVPAAPQAAPAQPAPPVQQVGTPVAQQPQAQAPAQQPVAAPWGQNENSPPGA